MIGFLKKRFLGMDKHRGHGDREERLEILLLREQTIILREILCEVKKIRENSDAQRYTVTVTQITGSKGDFTMAAGDNSIPQGGAGTFNAVLQDNGTPVGTQPTSWTWSTNDPSAVVTTDTSDPSGATVVVSIPQSDTSTSIIITATTADPTGAAVSGSLTVTVAAGVNKFTVVVSQTK